MTYSFILGRKHILSTAELFSCIDPSAKIIDFMPESCVIAFKKAFENPNESLNKLGGTIKIVEVFGSLPTESKSELITAEITEYIFKNHTDRSTKLNFAISLYSFAEKHEQILRKILTSTKKKLTEAEIKSRFINKNFKNPHTAAIIGEKLLRQGMEIVVIKGHDKVFIGKTVAIQDIENYTKRDYERPARDAKTGMLPPKLAQIMINLGGLTKIDHDQEETHAVQHTLYDPFCGIGTILSEGLLLGYNVIGSDLSQDALQKAQKNIQWTRQQYPYIKTKDRIFQRDAALINSQNLPEKIDLVITESYLGPPLSKFPPPELISKNFAYVRRLVLAFFKAIYPILRSGATVVISLPAYRRADRLFFMEDIPEDIEKLGFKAINPIPGLLYAQFGLKKHPRAGLIYDRPDQIVAREIWKFVRK